jgi:hemolysin activation/secretion protein
LPAAPDAQSLDPNAPRMQVSGFRIVGNQTVDTATLQALVDDQAGKAYNLFELNKLARRITDHYQGQGYPVARAVIPAQKISSGVVTIEVIEGKIDKFVFRGNDSYDAEFLARWGQPLVGEQVRIAPLEQRMLKINDLPGLEARAVLTPGAEYGTTTVDVSVEEDPVEGQVSINNYGREEVGEHRLDASVNLNNPFGIGDQLGFRGSYSQGGLIKMAGLNYSLPLNVDGTRLAINYTAVDYSIGGSLAALDINGETTLGGITVIHPFLRSPKENLFGTFNVRSFSGKQLMSDSPISKNSVVVMEAGMAWNRIDDRSNVTAAGLRVSSNFRDSREGERTDAQKFKIDGEISRLQRLGKTWDLKLAASAQWSPDTLADAEKFSLGGPTSVRGYPAADVRGDRGAFASIEVRYRTELGSVPSYLSLFTDGGYTARVHPGPGVSRSNTIGSAGFGVTLFPTKTLIAELAAAVPTGDLDPNDSRKNGRIWFNLTRTF